jgi:hypothetical protein
VHVDAPIGLDLDALTPDRRESLRGEGNLAELGGGDKDEPTVRAKESPGILEAAIGIPIVPDMEMIPRISRTETEMETLREVLGGGDDRLIRRCVIDGNADNRRLRQPAMFSFESLEKVPKRIAGGWSCRVRGAGIR